MVRDAGQGQLEQVRMGRLTKTYLTLDIGDLKFDIWFMLRVLWFCFGYFRGLT